MWYRFSIVLGIFVHSLVEAIPLNESFERGVIPEIWTVINNDGDGYRWRAHQDPGYARTGNWSASVYHNIRQNDDWLITPKLIVSAGDVFRFWARSYSSAFLEDLNILVSTTTPGIPSFTDTLDTLRGISNIYTQYVYPLDSYVGRTIYIAIQCVSRNKRYLFIDDVTGPEIFLPANDMCIDSILKPSRRDSLPGDTLYRIKITVKNRGSVTQIAIPVILRIIGRGYSYSDTQQTGSLEYDSTQQITFDWLTPNINAICTLKVWTTLPGDENPFNDTAWVRVKVYRKRFFESFEGGVIPSNWTVINNDGDSYQWIPHYSSAYAHSGNWSAYVRRNPNNQNDDWLITPKLEVDSGDVFSFWARSYSSSHPEDFNVRVSRTTCNIPAFTDTIATVRDIPTTYTRFAYPLDEYAGSKIFIAVQYISQNHYYLFVDDFSGPPFFFPDNEISMDTIYEPTEGAMIKGDSLYRVRVRVKNCGEFTQSNVPVILQIDGARGYSYSDTQLTGSLPRNASQLISFYWHTPDVGMSCTVKVWTELSTDEDRANDTTKVKVTVYRRGSLIEGFEGGRIPNNWIVIDNNGNGFKWVTANAPLLAHTGRWFATVHYSRSTNDDWLITPRLAVDSGDIFMFWARARIPSYVEAFNVRVSRTIPHIDSFTDTLATVTQVPNVYTQYLYFLDAYGGDSVYIALQSISPNGMYLDIDDFLGPRVLIGVEEKDKFPTWFDLSNSFPNPMRLKTTIFYQLPEEAKVSIKVYNCAGLMVRALVDKKLSPGYYSVVWDGLDDNGNVLPSGIYFYKMECAKFTRSRKLILVR